MMDRRRKKTPARDPYELQHGPSSKRNRPEPRFAMTAGRGLSGKMKEELERVTRM